MIKRISCLVMPLVWAITAALILSLFVGCAREEAPETTVTETTQPETMATTETTVPEVTLIIDENADTRSWDYMEIYYAAHFFGDTFFNCDREMVDMSLTQDYAFDKPVYHDFYEGLPPKFEIKNMPEDEATFEIGDVVQVSLEFIDPIYGDSFRHLSLELVKVKEVPNPDYDSWQIQFYGLE